MMTKLLTLSVNGTPIQTPGSISHVTPEKVGPLGENLFQLGLELLLVFAVVLSLFYLIWGGIQWITSGGDKQWVENARQKIIYAVIGLVLALGSFIIIKIIGTIFGIDLLNTFSQ